MTIQGEEIPSLDGLAYKGQKFIDTGSKMSDILLALDSSERLVALKIACVDQRARADVNRLAIKNTIEWLSKLGSYRGIIGLRSIEFTEVASWRSWLARPVYCAPLQHWPGQPEFLVMEYITGGSLRDFVGDKRLDIELALWIAHYIARSLAYIHQRGCVHRDIKPENILFRALPETGLNQGNTMPILIDFGVAAQIGADRLVSGSRLWMAPELQDAYERRPLAVDPSWDMYAVGLILCYMLTGRRPRHKNYEFQDYEKFREQTFAVLAREIEETSPGLRAAKLGVKQLLAKTLDKTPANRPTAQAFAAETATLLAGLGAPLPAYERWLMRVEQSRYLSSTNRRWLGVASLLIVVLALWVLVSFAVQRGFTIGIVIPVRPATALAAGTPNFVVSATSVEEEALATAMPAATTAAATQAEPAVPTTVVPPTSTAPPTATPTVLPPTLARFTPAASDPIPTLAPFTPVPAAPPPTLVPLTPTATPTELPATATPVISTPTPQTTVPPPTATRRPANTRTSTPTATRLPPTPRPLLGRVQLLAPESGVRAGTPKVTFAWKLAPQVPLADQCFELVFWEPSNAKDKRSPVGAGKATEVGVDFSLLSSNKDVLLQKVAQSKQQFNWGVRLVSCTNPKTILKEAEQVRAYTYDGQ